MHTSHQTTNSPKTTKSVPTQMHMKQNLVETINEAQEKIKAGT